ncbi:MAG: DNA alkylation repair protein [Chloroflexi bacterium]|nr:DNA alkylation repair protein [Chloroflexota bacterium]
MPEPLKNMFNAPLLEAFTTAFETVYPAFDRAAFWNSVYDAAWESRELKERIRHVTICLRAVLPQDYRTALDIIRRASPALDAYNFATIVFPDFVELYGLDDWDASIPALEQFTQQSTAEYAVRPFILRDTERMMAQMLAWAGHPNHHLRRLASEGCRPRLPWAMALPAFKADPSPILPILERLKLDESEYVRRSVANNLNDIAKDNPQVTLDTARRWNAHETPEMQSLISRALRTLVKQGNPAALALLGYAGEAAFAIQNLIVEPAAIPLNGSVTISFEIHSLSDMPQNLMIDYVVYLAGANGQPRRKVFKLSKKTLAPGETAAFSRRHSFAPVTTRRYYAGDHAVQIQVNGTLSEQVTFRVG